MANPADNGSDSQIGFWLKCWLDGNTGWHHQETNEHLLSHWHRLDVEPNARVFVPLCGKSRDMVWLAQQGHVIVGVEISAIAVEGFFSEQGLTTERTCLGPFQRLQAGKYELLCGDIFRLTPDLIPGIDAVYDRASLVALDAEYRRDYARLLADLLPAGCKVLLVAMDYPQAEMQGPPYSVPEAEVTAIFADDFQIAHLHTLDLLKDTARYSGRGLSRLSEHIYMLRRK